MRDTGAEVLDSPGTETERDTTTRQGAAQGCRGRAVTQMFVPQHSFLEPPSPGVMGGGASGQQSGPGVGPVTGLVPLAEGHSRKMAFHSPRVPRPLTRSLQDYM